MTHQFVVAQKFATSGQGKWQFELDPRPSARQALVVWVSGSQQTAPLQVVGGWIDPDP